LFFKQKFESLSSFQKIEMVLIILIFYGGVLYYVDHFVSFKNKKIIDEIRNTQLLNLTQKIDTIPYNKVLQYVQNRLVILDINNFSLIVQNQQLSLEFQTEYKKCMEFISILEKHFKIISLSIYPKKSFLKVQMVLDTRNIYNKNDLKRKSIEFFNPFYFQKEIPKMIEKQEKSFTVPTFQIDGVLADEVLVNQQWYQLGESVQNNQIIKIEQDRVLFKNKMTQKTFYKNYIP
jgi:hypothetical protein